MRRIIRTLLPLLLVFLLAGCGKTEGLQDGYYTAQAQNTISDGKSMSRLL